jgi:cell shape-determining protein MreC
MNIDEVDDIAAKLFNSDAAYEFALNELQALREENEKLRAENTGFRDLISEYQSYEHEVIKLRAELAAQQLKEGFVSVELAEEMFESLVEWSNYADDYFKKKWHLDDELAKYKALITASREK